MKIKNEVLDFNAFNNPSNLILLKQGEHGKRV